MFRTVSQVGRNLLFPGHLGALCGPILMQEGIGEARGSTFHPQSQSLGHYYWKGLSVSGILGLYHLEQWLLVPNKNEPSGCG